MKREIRANSATREILTYGHGRLADDPPDIMTLRVTDVESIDIELWWLNEDRNGIELRPEAERQVIIDARAQAQQVVRDAVDDIKAGPPPQSLPGLAARIEAIERILGLR